MVAVLGGARRFREALPFVRERLGLSRPCRPRELEYMETVAFEALDFELASQIAARRRTPGEPGAR